MANDLTPIPRPHFAVPALANLDLIAAIMAGVNERTAKTYAADYRDWARFVGAESPAAALEILLNLSPGSANAAVLSYRVHLADRKLAPGTVARRLVALRMAVKRARTLGLVTWSLDVEGPKAEAYRDTTGPGMDGWRAMLATAKREAETGHAKPVRDLALLRLFHDLALRRAEAVNLDVADVDLAEATANVTGKGKTAAEKMTLTRQCCQAVADWLAIRGDAPGPLFTRLDRAAKGAGRLTGEAIRLIIADLAVRAGIRKTVRPHGLRHQSITQALDATGGNIREVQRFSRHAKPETLMRYDDCRVDVAGKIAQLVADEE